MRLLGGKRVLLLVPHVDMKHWRGNRTSPRRLAFNFFNIAATATAFRVSDMAISQNRSEDWVGHQIPLAGRHV